MQKDRIKMKKTKIVCTIGPASRAPETLEQLIRAGMNVARLNFSHGTHDEHREVIQNIRAIAARLNRSIAVLQDIAGPKIRIGSIAEGTIHLETGQTFILTDRDVPGTVEQVSVNYHGLPKLVQEGDLLLLSDGALEMQVLKTSDHEIHCRVSNGGPLSSHKGVNLPSRSTGIPILTAKDREDIDFGLEQGVDYIGLSFVRTADDVREVRQLIHERGYETPLIAKIEKPEALENIDAILEQVEGLMVARGDLGVEIPFERVPVAQKTLIRKANKAGKPVITATQMLESMVHSPRPTRAEVTDVASAIFDGTDAVMLSEESAMGEYPVKAVEAMARIAHDVEAAFPYRAWTAKFDAQRIQTTETSVAHAACHLAEDLHTTAMITCTVSGETARQVARFRPPTLILAPTPCEETYRRLALVWGAMPIKLPLIKHTDHMLRQACEVAIETGFIKRGDQVVITAGVPVNEPGKTNFVGVFRAGEQQQ
jgi:pyruvate kinase